EDQEIVRASFERMSVTLNSATRKDNQGAFEALKNQGVAFTVPDEKFVASWEKVAEVASQQLVTELSLDPTLVQRINDILARYRVAGAAVPSQP
ncbi:MAG: hypothetical protein GY906_03875, partial [bacterium]|nr:hypothetical protein [bacterium]